MGSVEELANVLADRFQSVTVSDPAPEPGPRRGDEPNLTEARTALLTWAKEYLGHRIDMTPMAVVALLAPGKEDNLTSGSDVLINLLRYDPLAARAFMDAGVDLFKLFAVGVEINHRRWIAPRKWLMEDVCGFADQGAPTPAELSRRSRLGTADVLHGLLRGAQRRHKQRDLLYLTLRWMHPDESSEDRERRCNALIEVLLTRAAEGRDRFGRHGWLFLEHERGWTAEPVMLCEQAGNSIVLQVQTPRLFPTELREALASAAFNSIESVRTKYPEVSLTLRPPLYVSTVAYLSRPAADPATLLFSLDGVCRFEEWPGSGALAIDAPLRRPALDLPFGPAEWHRAVLATDEVPSTAGSSDPPSYQELAFQTLTPLAAHASIRDLEFDDI